MDLELDNSLGLTLGADLAGGPVTGQVGLFLIDSTGFFASVGWKF